MTADPAFSHSSPQPAGTVLIRQPPGLADEHDQQLRQVAVRAEDLLAAARDHWPARELDGLLGYLRAEVLRQATDEEVLLFPACGALPAGDHLARDHARLRAGIEVLELAAGDGGRSPAMLASTVRGFLRQLEAHLAAEEAILAAPGRRGGVPATTALGARPHEWYPLTEGAVIDLDTLPPDQAVAAAVQRLLRLDRGEPAELRSSSDPSQVWQRAEELAPGRCRFAYLEDGPGRWRVQVTRREQP
jgi:uncharacterized protein (DUF2249 family)